MFDVRHIPIIAYAVIALLTAALLIKPPSDSGDMAAWVQGVGTIVAVAVTAWIGFIPVRAEAMRLRKAREEYGASIDMIRFLLLNLRTRLQSAKDLQDLKAASAAWRAVSGLRIRETIDHHLGRGSQAPQSHILYVVLSTAATALATIAQRMAALEAAASPDVTLPRNREELAGLISTRDKEVAAKWAALQACIMELDFVIAGLNNGLTEYGIGQETRLPQT